MKEPLSRGQPPAMPCDSSRSAIGTGRDRHGRFVREGKDFVVLAQVVISRELNDSMKPRLAAQNIQPKESEPASDCRTDRVARRSRKM